MKILFTDFDGTLLDKGQLYTDKDISMMKSLQDKGHLVVICTGRNIREFLLDQEKYHFPFDYVVLNNGGHIIDKNYDTLYEKVIQHEVGIDILNHSTQNKGMWSFYCDGQETYAYKDGITYDHGLGDIEINKDFFELYRNAKDFQIICFHQHNEGIEISQKMFDYVVNHYHDQVEAYFNTHYVDVVPKGCSKGQAVHLLVELLQQPVEEIYAIGDSYNDLPMIKEATYGYTFHRAQEDIKKETSYHVDYVYEVVEKMLEGEKS